MPRKDRDYSNLRETARLYDAIHEISTQIKDYSTQFTITVMWRLDKEQIHRRFVQIDMGNQRFIGRSTHIADAVNDLMEDTRQDSVMPRGRQEVPGVGMSMVIDLTKVNQECLRDHMAEVTIGNNTAILDLEELLKATRYA